MSTLNFRGHERIADQFRRAMKRGRLASSFLFVGPAGIGKRTFALRLAQAWLCDRRPEEELDPCGQCDACQQVAAGTHPDLELISKPPDKNFIPIESLIGDREHRMRSGLCHNIALKPFYGGRKVAIIDDADVLNIEGANCLLKTLEEPPPRSELILLATNEQRQLPTIRSRCQIVRFSPLPTEVVADLLRENQLAASEEEATRLAQAAGGSLATPQITADTEVLDFREYLFGQLALPDWSAVSLAREVTRFVEAAGKETPPRRDRLRIVIGDMAEFHAVLMRVLSQSPPARNSRAIEAAETAARRWPSGAEGAGACVERCLEALTQLESNANLSTLIESWLDDLAQRGSGILLPGESQPR